MTEYYIGLMSGTSLDGVDGVVADFSGDQLHLLASASCAFDPDFKSELLALNAPVPNELHRAAVAGNAVAIAYADVVHQLLAQLTAQNLAVSQVRAIGAHGQTVRHQPRIVSKPTVDAGYTLQLINPALLAERTGIDVVADLRSRDIAAGGQGAPLVPAFHRYVFAQHNRMVSVLNLGGMANLSVLPGDATQPVLGFDCGPGNVLMDGWCQQHTGAAFDAAGAWSAQGHCLPDLLRVLRDERFFEQPPPKSTGRELFNLRWLQDKLKRCPAASPLNVQTTLAELTVSTCADSIRQFAAESQIVIVCGGGAYNNYLLQRLQTALPTLQVTTSDSFGLPPQQVEAAAFAWLARQTTHRQAGNLPSVTGAVGPRILGAIYPAQALG